MFKNGFNKLLSNPIMTIVAFAVFLRLLVFVLYQQILIISDSIDYIELAGLISDWNLIGYDGKRSPGYPVLLLFNSLATTVSIQILLGISTMIILYKILLLLKFDIKKALITTLFLSAFIHVIFYEFSILTESFTLFLFTSIVYLYLKDEKQNPSVKNLFYFSLLLGILILVKPFYFILPFIYYGFSAVQNFSIQNVFGRRLIILITPIICFLGWSYVNKLNTGYFVPTTFYGINTAQNCVYFAEKAPEEFHLIRDIYVKHRDNAILNNKDVAMSIWYAYDELIATTGLSFVDLSYQLNEFGKVLIKENPKDFIQQVLISWIDFWKTAIYWDYNHFNVPHANKVFIGIWYVQSTVLVIFKIGFLLLFPYQLYRFAVSRKFTSELVLSTVIIITSIAQALVTYGTNSRYSYPFEFLMIILVIRLLSQFKYRKTLVCTSSKSN